MSVYSPSDVTTASAPSCRAGFARCAQRDQRSNFQGRACTVSPRKSRSESCAPRATHRCPSGPGQRQHDAGRPAADDVESSVECRALPRQQVDSVPWHTLLVCDYERIRQHSTHVNWLPGASLPKAFIPKQGRAHRITASAESTPILYSRPTATASSMDQIRRPRKFKHAGWRTAPTRHQVAGAAAHDQMIRMIHLKRAIVARP